MKSVFACIALIALLFPSLGWAAPTQPDWTMLVFMNGKNNLEPFVLEDFEEMAKVGSTSKVNIIVQMGRLSTDKQAVAYEDWGGVKRFKVEKNMEPIAQSAVMDLGASGLSTDMGDPKVFSDFVKWGKSNYPAKHYMVVVWNHGQGWRLQIASRVKEQSDEVSKRGDDLSVTDITTTSYRSISSDDEFGSILYNTDVVAGISENFKSSTLDVLGFDACLMGMLETSYAFKELVNHMVASEELEPGAGWDYQRVLTRLNAQVVIDSKTAAIAVVDAYKERYGDDDFTTLSAVDVSKVTDLADALDALSEEMTGKLPQYRNMIKNARSGIKTYATSDAPSLKSSIDLMYFLDRLSETGKGTKLEALSVEARKKAEAMVVANYTSELRGPARKYGSYGIALFFPATLDDLKSDPDYEGYSINNTFKPVKFVQERKWSYFLQKYLGAF